MNVMICTLSFLCIECHILTVSARRNNTMRGLRRAGETRNLRHRRDYYAAAVQLLSGSKRANTKSIWMFWNLSEKNAKRNLPHWSKPLSVFSRNRFLSRLWSRSKQSPFTDVQDGCRAWGLSGAGDSSTEICGAGKAGRKVAAYKPLDS